MKRWLKDNADIVCVGAVIVLLLAIVYAMVGCAALGIGNKGYDASSTINWPERVTAGGDVIMNRGICARDLGWLAMLGWAWHWRRSRLATKAVDATVREIEVIRPSEPSARWQNAMVDYLKLPPVERMISRLAKRSGPEWRWFAKQVKRATKK